jgi:reactive intermediate/imine deaminase
MARSEYSLFVIRYSPFAIRYSLIWRIDMDFENRPEVEYLTSESMKGLPFSEAVRVGNMLYLSGRLGTDSSGKLVPGGIVAETRQTMENIRAALERYGSALDHVVKVTVMLADMAEWAAMNQVYVTYFPTHLPARSALGANGLALGARVEIECVAVLK